MSEFKRWLLAAGLATGFVKSDAAKVPLPHAPVGISARAAVLSPEKLAGQEDFDAEFKKIRAAFESGWGRHAAGPEKDKTLPPGAYVHFMGFDRPDFGRHYIPPPCLLGFIPTVAAEPWHWRYVGTKQAVAFWQQHYRDILDSRQGHLRYLVETGGQDMDKPQRQLLAAIDGAAVKPAALARAGR